MASKSRKKSHKNKIQLTVSPAHERKKIRESVLNVFKRKVENSPENSGALVVSGTSQTMSDPHSQELVTGSKKSKSSNKKDKNSPHSAMECLVLSDVQCKEQDTAMDLTRRKKRKTRSERNKLREKGKSKPVPEKQSELKKQISLAHNMMACRPERIHGERSSCVITQNRLTKRLGLFNQGKKSSSVVRDDINLPSKLKQVAEDDIRKILGRPKSTELEVRKSCDTREVILLNKTPSSVKSSYSLRRSTGPSPATFMSYDEEEEDETLKPCQSIPGSPDYIEITERITIKVVPLKYFPSNDYLRKTTTELSKLIRQNCPPLVCDTETPVRTTPHSHVSSDVVCRDLSPSLPPTPKKGSVGTRTVKLKENLSQQKQPTNNNFSDQGSVLASLFPENQQPLDFGSSVTSRSSRHSQSNKYQHMLETTDQAACYQFGHLGQAARRSTKKGDIPHTIVSANQANSFNMRQSSSLADQYHVTHDISDSYNFSKSEEQPSALYSLFANQSPVQTKPVVTQTLYPLQDSYDLLYGRNSNAQLHRGVDLLDDMDMEFQNYADSRERHESYDRTRRSYDEHFDPRDPSHWLEERPPPFLKSPTPPKQLYPRRLY